MASQLLFQDNTDATKKVAIDPASIATATTRTITMPDANVALGSVNSSTVRQGAKYTSTTGVTGQAKVQTLTDAATITWDVDSGYTATVTLAGNRTLAVPTNMENGDTAILRVVQDGTGSRTLSYAASYKWAGGTAPTLSTAASSVDILTFVMIGGNIYGSIAKAFA